MAKLIDLIVSGKSSFANDISAKNIYADNFIRNGSSNNYVLLGGGGHKALSDFSMSHSHPYLSYSSVYPTNTINLNDYFSTSTMYRVYYDYSGSSKIQNGPYESDAGAVINFPTYSGTQVYFNYYNNDVKVRTHYNGHITSWATFITSENIGSQSVNYSASAGNADTLDSFHSNRFTFVYNSANYNTSSSLTLNQMAADGNSNSHVGMIYAGTDNPVSSSGNWVHVWSQSWSRGSISSWCSQIALGVQQGTGMWYRTTSGALAGRAWNRVLDSANYTSYVNNYYWANVKISTSSNSATYPTFGSLAVINDSCDNSNNSLAYFQHRSNNDWTVKIDSGSYDYGLQINGSQTGTNALSVTGASRFTNTIRIGNGSTALDGNYCEGIRIRAADNTWATIILGATADTGTNTYAWSIHRTSGNNFSISRNSSDGANGLLIDTSGRVGIGTTSPSERLSVNGWVGTIGNTGWYSITYGGGWYMTDSTWVRSYNGKGVVAGGFYHSSYGSANYLLTSNGGAWAVHTGRNNEANKIVRTDGSGYLQTGYINTNVSTEDTLSCSRLFFECNNDGYIRKLTPARFRELITDSVYLPRLRMRNPSNGTSAQGGIPFPISLKGAGYPVYTDPEFASGNNSVHVYNNSGNGTVTISRISDNQGSSNSSGYILQISTTSGTASPGRGGFCQTIISRNNAVFAQIFRAKIPTGFSVVNAENAMGSGYSTHWLTDTAGTGKWEWYIRVTICGTGGSFSSGGHVYLSGSGAVTWYLSYCNLIDLTQGNYDGLRTRYSDYATSAGNADTVDGQHFNWNNNKNDHTYLWAASSSGNAYLVHRASMSVNYASSAGNADTTDGLHVHSGRNNEANKIVRTDGSGYIQCGYINSSSGNEGNNSSPARVWGTNGSDNYMRTYLTSALSVKYSTSAGNADTLDSFHANRFTFVYNSANYNASSSLTVNQMAADGNSNSHVGMIYDGTDNPVSSSGNWFHVWSQSWTRGSISSWCSQIALGVQQGTGMWYRTTSGALAGKAWNRVLDSANYTSYVNNYYWANVKISTSSNSATYPTFANMKSTGRVYLDEWIQFSGSTGLYWPNTNGAHLYANTTTSYAGLITQGSRGGYCGLQCGPGTTYMTVMSTDTHHGLYCENTGTWEFYYNRGNGGVGIRTSSITKNFNVSGQSYLSSNVWIGTTSGGEMLNVGGWVGTTGNTGWYSITHGGGLYMEDSTYIRVYNSKRIYNANTSQYAFYTSGGMTALGHMYSNSSACSWIAGQNATNAALNIGDATNTGSYWPWFRQTNTSSKKWFSVGTLNNSLYFIGSATSRTASSYDYGFRMDFSDGYLYGNFSGYLSGRAAEVTVNNSDSNSTYRMVWHSGNTLYGTGGIYCNPSTDTLYASAFYESSDIRLKQNIKQVITSNDIPQIKEFDWKNSGKHSYGLIAQELESMGYSELVDTKDDGYKSVNYTAALCLIIGKLQLKIKELEDKIKSSSI